MHSTTILPNDEKSLIKLIHYLSSIIRYETEGPLAKKVNRNIKDDDLLRQKIGHAHVEDLKNAWNELEKLGQSSLSIAPIAKAEHAYLRLEENKDDQNALKELLSLVENDNPTNHAKINLAKYYQFIVESNAKVVLQLYNSVIKSVINTKEITDENLFLVATSQLNYLKQLIKLDDINCYKEIQGSFLCIKQLKNFLDPRIDSLRKQGFEAFLPYLYKLANSHVETPLKNGYINDYVEALKVGSAEKITYCMLALGEMYLAGSTIGFQIPKNTPEGVVLLDEIVKTKTDYTGRAAYLLAMHQDEIINESLQLMSQHNFTEEKKKFFADRNAKLMQVRDKYFKDAMSQGNAEAMYHLALLEKNGFKNLLMKLGKASRGQSSKANILLSWLFLDLSTKKQCKEELAFYYLNKALQKNNLLAKMLTSQFMVMGMGFSEGLKESKPEAPERIKHFVSTVASQVNHSYNTLEYPQLNVMKNFVTKLQTEFKGDAYQSYHRDEMIKILKLTSFGNEMLVLTNYILESGLTYEDIIKGLENQNINFVKAPQKTESTALETKTIVANKPEDSSESAPKPKPKRIRKKLQKKVIQEKSIKRGHSESHISSINNTIEYDEIDMLTEKEKQKLRKKSFSEMDVRNLEEKDVEIGLPEKIIKKESAVQEISMPVQELLNEASQDISPEINAIQEPVTRQTEELLRELTEDKSPETNAIQDLVTRQTEERLSELTEDKSLEINAIQESVTVQAKELLNELTEDKSQQEIIIQEPVVESAKECLDVTSEEVVLEEVQESQDHIHDTIMAAPQLFNLVEEDKFSELIKTTNLFLASLPEVKNVATSETHSNIDINELENIFTPAFMQGYANKSFRDMLANPDLHHNFYQHFPAINLNDKNHCEWISTNLQNTDSLYRENGTISRVIIFAYLVATQRMPVGNSEEASLAALVHSVKIPNYAKEALSANSFALLKRFIKSRAIFRENNHANPQPQEIEKLRQENATMQAELESQRASRIKQIEKNYELARQVRMLEEQLQQSQQNEAFLESKNNNLQLEQSYLFQENCSLKNSVLQLRSEVHGLSGQTFLQAQQTFALVQENKALKANLNNQQNNQTQSNVNNANRLFNSPTNLIHITQNKKTSSRKFTK